MRLFLAEAEFREAQDTNRQFDALCRALKAGRELAAYEAKMAYLAELRAELAERRAAAAQPQPREPDSR